MDKCTLPIGIQSFRNVRERNCYFVDKTGYALRLFREGTYFFLSRPRRFGKSLFVDTLKHLFEGDRDLFEGLEAYNRWDWSVRYPVVRLDFAGLNATRPGALEEDVLAQLLNLERNAGVRARHTSGPRRLEDLIRTLHRDAGQPVCVLVDEYDKPILDALEDRDLARANRDYLSGLYGMLKACDQDIRFAFLTGVSKFSNVSLFSGLNNLRDITLNPAYSAICGYTDRDLDTVFAAELPGLDRERIREWYNGYTWGGEQEVYNPFDVLLLFAEREFKAWWFETGTPSFLVKTLVERNISTASLDGMLASEGDLGKFEVDSIAPEALLFQTGYLTIGGQETCHGEQCYRLVYPNREVRLSLNATLLTYLTGRDTQRRQHRGALAELLTSGDLTGLERRIRALYESIPYEWHTRNEIARYEGYYSSVFYSYVLGLDVEVTVEDSSNRGRLDLAVQAGSQVYLFEFKLWRQSGSGSALAQLKDRDYAAKYRHLGLPIHLVPTYPN
ncbi:MAG: AAA family ATPase [Bryobacterales bacterium]|nr:AAA family ATPase [Bryobacterales bacterium]